jgi:aminopeptidase N/puromycin-sensitive aminopeptidase
VSGDRALYDQYLEKVKALSAQPEESYRFFNALASFRDPSLVQRTLDYSLSPDVRSQDTGSLIAHLLSHPWSQQAAWDFTRTNWARLTEKLGTFQGIPTIIGALGGFCSAQQANDLKQFFAKNPVPSSERGLRQAFEQIDTCVDLDARQSPAFARWLSR